MREVGALPTQGTEVIASVSMASLVVCLAIAPGPRPASQTTQAAAHRRDRAIVLGAGIGATAGLGLAFLAPGQALRFTRDRRAIRRCTQQTAAVTPGDESPDPTRVCFGEARHPLGTASLAALGFVGGAVIIGGAAQIGSALGKLGHPRDARPRTRPAIAVGATLTAIGGATILVGAPLLFARQRRAPLSQWSRWQGARLLVTDAGILVAAVGVGVITHAVTRRDRQGARHVRVHPMAGRHEAGIAATIVW